MGRYWTGPAWQPVSSRSAKLIKSRRVRTYGRLYLYDTLLKRLAKDFEDMAAARRPCIQQEHPMVRPRHVARHRHLAATDEPHSRDRVMGGTKWARRDERRAGPGVARPHDGCAWCRWPLGGSAPAGGGEPARQHRLACPRRTQQQDVWVRTPASASLSPQPPGGSGDRKDAGPQPHV
jgi:hypothetical protein